MPIIIKLTELGSRKTIYLNASNIEVFFETPGQIDIDINGDLLQNTATTIRMTDGSVHKVTQAPGQVDRLIDKAISYVNDSEMNCYE